MHRTIEMVQQPVTSALDSVDAQILAILATDGRIANNALASRVGIAPSTCLQRIRGLRQRGVLRGFAADIDPTALGHPVQAMVSVRMQSHARAKLTEFMDAAIEMPGVLNAYLLGGSSDFLLHVASSSVDRLHEFVIEQLSGNPDVAATETNLIFKYARTRVPVISPAQTPRPQQSAPRSA
ncbi:Lrp/AsnC family transcriptional regulator [Nocardia pseudovaccinii]|uniref:Lrp/AsnC family transcriptional regulator n=1 Tax=Nocardia pseudovaccinii TaxID=189540 RepID=UPI003D93371D